MKWLIVVLMLLFPARAMNLGSQQLIVSVVSKKAYLNGQAVYLSPTPRMQDGRAYLPLRAVLDVLNVPWQENSGVYGVGLLRIDTNVNILSLNGQNLDSSQMLVQDGSLMISSRVLSEALQANLSLSEEGKTLTLTLANTPNTIPENPQARFLTNKSVYAMGEKISYIDYSFDPEGSDIVARRWQNKQEVFFSAGEYTIGLQVANSKNRQSELFTRTITVSGEQQNTPLSYALKYQAIGTTFPDDKILSYPVAPIISSEISNSTLVFSDSPETPTQSGILYQDRVSGRVRILAYHMNGMETPARLYVIARNVEVASQTLTVQRFGETAPTGTETTLGQGTLVDFYAQSQPTSLELSLFNDLTLYASPLLRSGRGVNVMMDIDFPARTLVTVLFVQDGLPVDSRLPILPPDGKHVRGTFAGADQELTVYMQQLPARVVIGDENIDPTMIGVDATTMNSVLLKGNYGKLYTFNLLNAPSNTVAALSPRGGLYKGVIHADGDIVRLPESGVLTRPNYPILFGRDTKRIEFIPASGSNLPVNLVFYPAQKTP